MHDNFDGGNSQQTVLEQKANELEKQLQSKEDGFTLQQRQLERELDGARSQLKGMAEQNSILSDHKEI
jgi:hypothetical protein